MEQDRLRVTEICVDFFGLRALDHVSLDINVREIVGLIGPNGSGKTTLVNAITGQVTPSGGAIHLGNDDITGLSPRHIALRGITRSFQQVRLFNQLTVEDNVSTTALAQGLSRRRARQGAMELLHEFHLDHFADHLAGTLNYGDKRRVEIVRALAAQPRFLLLDEPAAGMNEAESEILLDTLAQLPRSKNLGMLIIDHDMPLIMRLCQRLHVLSSGKTIGQGDVETVQKLPAVVEAYLGSCEAEEELLAQG
jgi:branched-chain amino acid transport system ATP-binding protein